jgi:L-alanine-DL-glutamate epimerase-like enolase superfamily enzyme
VDYKATMKIVSIDAIHLRIEDPNIGLFDGSYDDCLIVVTADDGRQGIGEVESFSPAIVALVNGPSSHNHAMCLHDLLVGETLDDPERLRIARPMALAEPFPS